MSYFESFDYINYNFPDNVNRLYKNLSLRIDLIEYVKRDSTVYQPYYVKENETPEIVSYNLYETVDYHWCIMLVNEIMNLYTDWPKDTNHLNKFLLEKYRKQTSQSDSEVLLSDVAVNELLYFTGSPSNLYEDSDGKYGVVYRPHHFEDDEKNVYSFDTAQSAATDAFGRPYVKPTLTPVSHYIYEYELNEDKRNILVPSPSFVEQMEKEFKQMIRG